MTNVRTFAQDIITQDNGYGYGTHATFGFGEAHMVATLAEMCRTSWYERQGGEVQFVDIEWHRLDRGGYTRTGEYFGSGARVYSVQCYTGHFVRTFWVRAPSRPELRIALRRLFPLAKIAL